MKTTVISSLKLIEIAKGIEENFVVSVASLSINNIVQKSSVIELLLEHFPVLRLSDGNRDLLINMRELVLDPQCFTTLLKANKDQDKETKEVESTSSEVESMLKHGPKNKPGRQPLWQAWIPFII